jgi:hypothetical protein
MQGEDANSDAASSSGSSLFTISRTCRWRCACRPAKSRSDRHTRLDEAPCRRRSRMCIVLPRQSPVRLADLEFHDDFGRARTVSRRRHIGGPTGGSRSSLGTARSAECAIPPPQAQRSPSQPPHRFQTHYQRTLRHFFNPPCRPREAPTKLGHRRQRITRTPSSKRVPPIGSPRDNSIRRTTVQTPASERLP